MKPAQERFSLTRECPNKFRAKPDPVGLCRRWLVALVPGLIVALLLSVTAESYSQPAPKWRLESTLGVIDKLVWQTDADKSYDLWWATELTGWTHVSGFPKDGTGGEVACQFTPGRQQFFKIVAQATPPAGFALIAGGRFLMGDQSSGLVGGGNEHPVHAVNVKAFYLGKHEVTKALWDEVVLWSVVNQKGYDLSSGGGKAADHPVHSINWFEMVKWCNARSERDGLMPCYTLAGAVYRMGETVPDCNWEADGYRLPTEAEWENAARGGLAGMNFPWGDTIAHSNANYSSYGSFSYDVSPTKGEHPTYSVGATPHTSPVGSFAPNDYGLFDMAGNVWEQCWDWYASDYYQVSLGTDPRGPASGSARVQRGGSWGYNSSYCRVAHRFYSGPTSQGYLSGFRLARSIIPGGLVFILTGPFPMGDQSSPRVGDTNELPVHTVQVPGFYLAKYEVTKALWDEVRTWGQAHGYTDLADGQGRAVNHPVNMISWLEAVKWCNARSEKEGLRPCYSVSGAIYKTGGSFDTNPDCDWSANGYRLPTEAEWEKAARGGLTGRNFPWGDTITHSQANYKSDGAYSYDISPTRGYHPTYATGESELYTSPVGSFAPNGYGLYDRAGNVWEWCWDVKGDYAPGPQTDPRGPAAGWERVIRGGCWMVVASYCRTAEREFCSPHGAASWALGFRVARSASH